MNPDAPTAHRCPACADSSRPKPLPGQWATCRSCGAAWDLARQIVTPTPKEPTP